MIFPLCDSIDGLIFSGFEHHGQCNEQPFKNTVVLIPGPSCNENRWIFVTTTWLFIYAAISLSRARWISKSLYCSGKSLKYAEKPHTRTIKLGNKSGLAFASINVLLLTIFICIWKKPTFIAECKNEQNFSKLFWIKLGETKWLRKKQIILMINQKE